MRRLPFFWLLYPNTKKYFAFIQGIFSVVVYFINHSVIAEELIIKSIKPNKTEVPVYEKFELDLDISATYDNPFDPDQIKVDATFISPTKKFQTIAGFAYQDYSSKISKPEEARKTVNLLKIFITKSRWPKNPILYINNVKLINTKTKKEVQLNDLWKGQSCEVAITTETVKVGNESLKVHSFRGEWPGAVKEFDKSDWSEYNLMQFWIYPKVDYKELLPLGVEFYTPTKYQKGFVIKPNQWNLIKWDWSNFMPTQLLTPKGDLIWKVRFCPTEVGIYTYFVTVKDKSGEVKSESFTFQSVSSTSAGFIRLSRDNRYFEFDNGKPYFAIGHNVCWPGSCGAIEYDTYFKRMSENGENYTRIWMCPWAFQIEWDKRGVGWYRMDEAWKLDYVFELARKYGIRIMLCLIYHGAFSSICSWNDNPYNSKNGGPCDKASDFFTNEFPKTLFKNRLRYIVARYGWDTYLLSWEFFNEVNLVDDYNSERIAAWHQEMARYIRSIDPWKHLITTSYCWLGDSKIWSLPEIEYAQTHFYDYKDVAELMIFVHNENRKYGKPHFVGEFGLDPERGLRDDPLGINLHNGIWASIFLDSAGTGMLWWWDNYIEPNNLYYHFKHLSKFIKDVAWNTAGFSQITGEDFILSYKKKKKKLSTLELEGKTKSWKSGNPVNKPNTFVISSDGKVSNIELLSGVIHGVRNHKDKHNPQTFEVEYPADGKFIVDVSGVSGWGGANLLVYLDDKLVLRRIFSDPDDTENKAEIHRYNGSYEIAVPKGKHEIVVDNDGNDWIMVSYRLINAYISTEPNLRLIGLKNDTSALIWLQNKSHTWWRKCVVKEKIKPEEGVKLQLKGFKDGIYRCEFWDTWSGKIIKTDEVFCKAGLLKFELPVIEKDIALKIKKTK